MKTVFVCGDCAAVLLADGGVRNAEVHTIPLGQQCEAHEAAMGGGMHATSVVDTTGDTLAMLTSKLRPTQPTLPESSGLRDPLLWTPPTKEPCALDENERASLARAGRLGPVTEIATRLLVGWTAAEKGANADAVSVQFAVDTARKLLRETGGA